MKKIIYFFCFLVISSKSFSEDTILLHCEGIKTTSTFDDNKLVNSSKESFNISVEIKKQKKEIETGVSYTEGKDQELSNYKKVSKLVWTMQIDENVIYKNNYAIVTKLDSEILDKSTYENDVIVSSKSFEAKSLYRFQTIIKDYDIKDEVNETIFINRINGHINREYIKSKNVIVTNYHKNSETREQSDGKCIKSNLKF
jgi:hypothetical protein